jgi:hypothetical protein
MSTDDRDTESQNPSKSFKVGEVDRLSGFFTPVWESKRRLRAGSPIPPSSAAASAPSSARNADKNARPSTPPPSSPSQLAAEQPPAAGAPEPPFLTSPARPHRASSPPRAALGQRSAAAPPIVGPKTTAPQAAPVQTAPAKAAPAKVPPPRRAMAAKDAPAKAERAPAEPVPTPQGMTAIEPSPSAGAWSIPASLEPLAIAAPTRRAEPLAMGQRATVDAAAAIPEVPEPRSAETSDPAPSASDGADSPLLEADALAGTALTAAVAVSARPLIPMPSSPGRAAARPKAPASTPNAAAVVPKRAGHDLGEDHRDREPEFRAPPAPLPRRSPNLAIQQRSGRAAAAAAVLHEKIERKLSSDSVDTFARHRETESEREALQAAAARAAATPADPYPSRVLRTLRRTIHLSTPLPEAVRQMVDKYRY